MEQKIEAIIVEGTEEAYVGIIHEEQGFTGIKVNLRNSKTEFIYQDSYMPKEVLEDNIESRTIFISLIGYAFNVELDNIVKKLRSNEKGEDVYEIQSSILPISLPNEHLCLEDVGLQKNIIDKYNALFPRVDKRESLLLNSDVSKRTLMYLSNDEDNEALVEAIEDLLCDPNIFVMTKNHLKNYVVDDCNGVKPDFIDAYEKYDLEIIKLTKELKDNKDLTAAFVNYLKADSGEESEKYFSEMESILEKEKLKK